MGPLSLPGIRSYPFGIKPLPRQQRVRHQLPATLLQIEIRQRARGIQEWFASLGGHRFQNLHFRIPIDNLSIADGHEGYPLQGLSQPGRIGTSSQEAIDGNIVAMKEIGDRLDGRAAQPITGDKERKPLRVIYVDPTLDHDEGQAGA